MNNRKMSAVTAVFLALALFAAGVGLAQTPAPITRNNVTIIHIKPDMLNEWVDLQKNEVLPALKKAGVTSVTTLRTVWGSGYEYTTITPMAKFADRDGQSALTRALGAEAAARLNAKLRRCVVSSQSYISIRMDELSNLPPGAAPPISVSTRLRVAPGKAAEWENFVMTELLPIYKKANDRYQVSRRSYGANTSDRMVSTYAATFADLDAGSLLTRTLGAEGVAKLMAKGAALSTSVETLVRQRVADLSY